MDLQSEQKIDEKIDNIIQSFTGLQDRFQRAYTLVSDARTVTDNLLNSVPCSVLAFDQESGLLRYANHSARSFFQDFINSPTNKSLNHLGEIYTFSRLENNEYQKFNPFNLTDSKEGCHLSDVTLSVGTETIPIEVWIDYDVQGLTQKSLLLVIILDVSERKRIENILRDKIKLEAEFKSADRILNILLPEKTPKIKNFDLAAHCITASSVGGDFYDWYLDSDNNLIFSLGDVMGKEMSAALLMTTLRSALRTIMLENIELDQTMEKVATHLTPDLERLGSFATLFHGFLQPEDNKLSYISAGHTGGFILRSQQGIESLGESNLPLGIQGNNKYNLHQCSLEKGDHLILYTRGIIHSYPEKNENELDSIQTKMSKLIKDCCSPQEIVQTLFQATEESGKIQDRTVLVLSCTE